MNKNTISLTEEASKVVLQALAKAYRDGLINVSHLQSGFNQVDHGHLPCVQIVGTKHMVSFTNEGLTCDCEKGLMCPQNLQHLDICDKECY